MMAATKTFYDRYLEIILSLDPWITEEMQEQAEVARQQIAADKHPKPANKPQKH